MRAVVRYQDGDVRAWGLTPAQRGALMMRARFRPMGDGSVARTVYDNRAALRHAFEDVLASCRGEAELVGTDGRPEWDAACQRYVDGTKPGAYDGPWGRVLRWLKGRR